MHICITVFVGQRGISGPPGPQGPNGMTIIIKPGCNIFVMNNIIQGGKNIDNCHIRTYIYGLICRYVYIQ